MRQVLHTIDGCRHGGGVMIDDELAAEIQRRAELVARVVARHQDDETTDMPVDMRGPCSSSGYCGCNCRPCLGGIHRCGHRKGCHKQCRSLL